MSLETPTLVIHPSFQDSFSKQYSLFLSSGNRVLI